MALSNDSKSVAIGTGNGTVSIWNMATGEKRSEFDPGFFVTSIQFGPDGRTLAVGTIGFRVQLWDVTTGKKAW